MKLKLHKTRNIILLLAIGSLIVFGWYGCDSSGCNRRGPDCGDYDTCSEGAYDTTQDLRAGPRGSSGLFYPTTGDGPFPILVFGCGAGTGPNAYVEHGNFIASWGFVVVIETSSGSGRELLQAIDWLEDQNGSSRSPLYQRCNLAKVAAGGHSLGSLGTFQIADDPRLTTTIQVAGGSGGSGGRDLVKPVAYICGDGDRMGTNQSVSDYENSNVPAFMTVMDSTDHIMATRNGRPAIVAWLLWHLSGETERKADFTTQNGNFLTGMWNSEYKNW